MDAGGQAAAAGPAGRRGAPARRELRLALGMRGGVSLAVWIGGACAEIDTLRRAGGEDPPGSFYRRLLDAAGFEGVQVDVLAGASAGGLNGALLAASLMYGVDFAAFRDVWLDVAALDKLLEGDPDTPRKPVSVLRGDYFLDQITAGLTDQLATRDRSRSAPGYLDLHLAITATTAQPVAVTDDWAAWYAEESYRAGFRFRHNRYTSDFTPDPGTPAGDEIATSVAGKLALAARASSSFPAAFEPVRVTVERPEEVGRRGDPGDGHALFGLFTNPSRSPSWVVDGGVLDNIPVGRAIESIAEAPATGATERWLLYLCPSPEELTVQGPAKGSWDGQDPPHVLWTLKAVSRASGSRESILEDLAALREHNARAGQYRAARDLLVGRLLADSEQATTEALLGAGGSPSAVKAYTRDAAAQKAARVRALLEDPVQALGEDPFPAPGLTWPLWEHAGDAWTRPLRARLEKALAEAVAAAMGDAALAGTATDAAPLGPAPITRATRLLTTQVRRLEAFVPAGAGRDLGMHKQALYALGDAAALLAHMGELFWPLYLAEHRPALDEAGVPVAGDFPRWAREAVTAQAGFLATAARSDTVGAGAGSRAPAGFSWLGDELRRRLAAGGNEASWRDADDLIAWLWGALAERTRAIADTVADLDVAADPDDDADLAVSIGVLRTIAAGSADPLRCLVALEVVSAPLTRLDPMPPQPIRFARLSGTNATTLPFPTLTRGGRIDVAAKLNGNALANFAAFYKASWRANDWMWGRLDGVGTLLHVLLRPEELAPRLAAAGDDGAGFVDAVRGVVTASFPAGGKEDAEAARAWARRFAELWETHGEAVAAEVAAVACGKAADLGTTVEVLTERRHWELVAAELPVVLDHVRAERDGATASRGRRRRLRRRDQADIEPVGDLGTPEALEAAMASYAVGRESIAGDLGSDALTRLVTDAALASWEALRYAQGGGGPWLMRPVGAGLRVARWSVLRFPLLRRFVGLGPRAGGRGRPGATSASEKPHPA